MGGRRSKLQCRRQLKHHLQTVGQGGVPDPENEPSESEHVNTETHSERRRARVRRPNVKTSLNTDSREGSRIIEK